MRHDFDGFDTPSISTGLVNGQISARVLSGKDKGIDCSQRSKCTGQSTVLGQVVDWVLAPGIFSGQMVGLATRNGDETLGGIASPGFATQTFSRLRLRTSLLRTPSRWRAWLSLSERVHMLGLFPGVAAPLLATSRGMGMRR